MEVRGILNATAFFNVVLDARQLDRLAEATRVVRFRRGEVIMRQNDLGSSMFVLVDGKVTVSVHEPGGDRVAAMLGPGEVVGEMSLITGDRRSATVKAKGRVTALEISKAALEPILAAEPRLAERFATVVEQRHAELASRHAEARRWVSVGVGREEIAAQMTAFYSG